LAIADVHNDKMMHDARKITAKIAVNFFRTSAVDVPNTESPESPPKDAPRPELLLSWIRITKQSKTQSNKNKEIVKK
jgi:hypothetical protein